VSNSNLEQEMSRDGVTEFYADGELISRCKGVVQPAFGTKVNIEGRTYVVRETSLCVDDNADATLRAMRSNVELSRR